LHFSYGVGAFTAPLFVRMAQANSSTGEYSASFYLFGVLLLIPGVIILFLESS
jgi:hypothetical protein